MNPGRGANVEWSVGRVECRGVGAGMLNCEKSLLSVMKTLAVGERGREVRRWKVNGGVNRRSVM